MRSTEFLYTSCYCEENVYKLCKALVELRLAQASDTYVVFISNSSKEVPVWCQKNSKDAQGFCLWDYHVVCIQKSLAENTDGMVWDLDTTLGVPVSFGIYVEEVLRPAIVKNSAFRRLFRVVSAAVFLKHFASDRRHMKSREGQWLAPPPEYECIVSEDGTVHNLEAYTTMDASTCSSIPREELITRTSERFGCVLNETDFCRLFSSE